VAVNKVVVKLNGRPHVLGKTKVTTNKTDGFQCSQIVIKCEHHKEDKSPLHLPQQEPKELAKADADLNDEQWGGAEFNPNHEKATHLMGSIVEKPQG
jgi:hypothetical protein